MCSVDGNFRNKKKLICGLYTNTEPKYLNGRIMFICVCVKSFNTHGVMIMIMKADIYDIHMFRPEQVIGLTSRNRTLI